MQPALSQAPEPDPREQALARTIGVPDILARVLLNRGYDDPDKAREHLRPDLSSLADPFSFAQMKRAVERIKTAVRNGERIVIHGDYDVDGITGTVLLVKFFRLMEVDVQPFIPDRNDGYSITAASVAAIRDLGADLLISVDNGTNAVGPIAEIQALGCDVIVTDHHGTTEGVAEAFAVLNPRLPEAGYPDRDLAGVGVAFKLCTAVAESFSRGKSLSKEFRNFLVEALAYVALGTIADVAPLCGENRVMTHHGLRALAVSRNPGIRALIDAAGLGDRSPDAEDISFRIAPLINAAGRMGHAKEAVKLLVAPGYQEAQEAAAVLEGLNRERRKVEQQVVEEAMGQAEQMDDAVLVLGSAGWHRGVLGIVAARVAERLQRPALLLSYEDGIARGSGRSVAGFHLRNALSECSDRLLAYGGHHAAVGLEIRVDDLPGLRQQINEVARAADAEPSPLQIDGLADLGEIEAHAVRKLDMLGPYGPGNRRPVFLARQVKVVGNPSVDARGQDLRFKVAQGGAVLPVRLHRGAGLFESLRQTERHFDLCFSPRIATWADEGPVYLHSWHLEESKGSQSS